MEKISNWRVSDLIRNSDHRAIVFEVLSDLPDSSPPYRNIKKTDWGLYRQKPEQLSGDCPINQDLDLDRQVEQLNCMIMQAYRHSCPQITGSSKVAKLPWWNENLTRLKRLHKQATQLYSENRTEVNRDLRNRTRIQYKSEINKARNEHWKNFCENMEQYSTVARIQKVMKNDMVAKLGTLKKTDGSYTSNESETLNELFNCLLPVGMANNNHRDPSVTDNLELTEQKLIEMINHNTVSAVIQAFDPFKSPGLELATSWLKIKTVFIPKPGKINYITAKFFRPISLMSFVLKTLEKLIFWHLLNGYWYNPPINNRVYSYREGISTETALHDVTEKIERALSKKQMVLTVYMDISGAFSNTAVHSMTNALVKRGVEKEIIEWTEHLLTKRTAIATLGNTTEKQGCQ